jgi:hypothetical protein
MKKWYYHYSFNIPSKMILLQFLHLHVDSTKQLCPEVRKPILRESLRQYVGDHLRGRTKLELNFFFSNLLSNIVMIQFYVPRFAAANYALGHGNTGLVIFPNCGRLRLRHHNLSQEVPMGTHYRTGLTSRSVLGLRCDLEIVF